MKFIFERILNIRCFPTILLVTLMLIIFITIPATSISQSDIQGQINNELQDLGNKISGQAIVLIYSDTSWSGSILDSGFDSATKDGSGDSKIPIACGSNGIYSMAIQKQTESGYLTVAVIQDGKLLDSQSTTADYGVVSVAGNCASGGFLSGLLS